MKTLLLLAIPLLALVASGSSAVAQKLFDEETLVKTRFIADLQSAPDGSFAVVRLTDYDGGEKFLSDYHMVKLDGAVVRLTSSGKNSGPFAIAPDSKSIVFSGERNGKQGIYSLSLAGGEALLIKELAADADNLRFTRGGIYFTAMVFPDCGADYECTKKRLDDRKKVTSAMVFDKLLYRPWDVWRNGTYSNLFVLDPKTQIVTPVISGEFDIPNFPTGGVDAYTVSEDGNKVIASIKISKDPARSTNTDLYETSRGADGKFKPIKKLTTNPAADDSPIFSPDSTKVAYRSQSVPGFESDLWKLQIMELKTGEITTPNPKFDRWVVQMDWAPDGKGIYFVQESRGYEPLDYTEIKAGSSIKDLVPRTVVRKLSVGKSSVWYTRESLVSPPALWVLDIKSGQHRVAADFNKDTTGAVSFGTVEEVWYEGSKDKNGKPRRIQGFLAMPPGYKSGTKLPVVILIHGGPQGSCLDNFHPRWNAMVFASKGFAVFMPNFTGSTGYGQEFINAISKDWGGAPYEDVMAGLEHLKSDHRMDTGKACAIGGSYGGYMVNWIAGHTDVFKCLVAHASVFNLTAKYGTTDELWFPEWEFGGTPWTSPDQYKKWSPHNYVTNFKTPVLVIHGANDFRVPLEQGTGMYQYSKSMGVDAKLVVFPDEDHFVQKPGNRLFWYKTVSDWMKGNTK